MLSDHVSSLAKHESPSQGPATLKQVWSQLKMPGIRIDKANYPLNSTTRLVYILAIVLLISWY